MPNNADILRVFLEHPDRPAGTLTYAQLQGFLFAIAGAPEPILPSDWIPEAVGSAVQFEDSDAGAAAFMALVHESQAVAAASLDGGMPPGCVLRDDPIANLEEDAPIREWARGFARGYGWLYDTWEEYLPAESDDPREQDLATELSSSVMVLSFFASPAIAEALVGEALDADLPAFAAEVHGLFPDALRSYAGIGQAIQTAWELLERKAPYQRESPKIGRNDPCPCGSGRKYKRCCGAAH